MSDCAAGRKKPQPKISATTIALIKRMAMENRTWGAERIQGELLKLDISAAKRTIQRHMKNVRPSGGGQTWATFLKNHDAWACDFFQLYDFWFRPVLAFFIVDVNTKEVLLGQLQFVDLSTPVRRRCRCAHSGPRREVRRRV
jgi:hypothetical protein